MSRKLYVKIKIDKRGKKVPYFGKVWGELPKKDANTRAVKTGNGLMVVDIDTKDLSNIDKKLIKLLPKTPTIETANGYHWYFRGGDDIPQTQALVKLVDIRNEGGVVFDKYWGDDGRVSYKKRGKTYECEGKLRKYLKKLSAERVTRTIDTVELQYKEGEPWGQFIDGEQHVLLMATMIKMFNDRATKEMVWSRAKEYQDTYLSGQGYTERHESMLMKGRFDWAVRHIEKELTGHKLKELPPPKSTEEDAIEVEVIADIDAMIDSGEDHVDIVAEITKITDLIEREGYIAKLAKKLGVSVVAIRAEVKRQSSDGVDIEPLFSDYMVSATGEVGFLNTHTNMKELLRLIKIKGKYDVILKDISVDGWDTGEANWKDTLRSHIISEAMKKGIPRIAVEDHLAVAIRGKNKNPLLKGIKDVEWDGKDWIKKLAKRLKVDKGLTEYRDVILMRWLIQCVSAWDGAENTPRKDALPKYEYIFTLGGGQGVNKTTFFTKLMGGKRRRYFHSGSLLKPNDRDSVKQNTSFGMVELGELDATTRKSDIAEIKAFMSNEHDVYRVSYGREDERHRRRTSFCASVNPEEFLVDSTGARRFMYLRLKSVIKLKGVDFEQVWAQAWSLYRGGERWWIEREDDEYQIQLEVNESATDDGVVGDVAREIYDRIKTTPKDERHVRMSTTKVWELLTGKIPTKAERMGLLNVLRADGKVKATQKHGISVPRTL